MHRLIIQVIFKVYFKFELMSYVFSSDHNVLGPGKTV